MERFTVEMWPLLLFIFCTEGQQSNAKLQYTANRTLALCNHLHRQHANAKLANNTVLLKLGVC